MLQSASRSHRRVGRRGGVIGRAAVAILVLAAGFYAASQSFAFAIRQKAVGVAVRLAPYDARILASYAETLAANTTALTQWDRAAAAARRALLRDPLLPSAAAILGFRAGMAGDNEGVRKAFSYSESISRRDLKTHLWAIEYAVTQDDIAGALRHYDLALRTSRRAPAILFPVLAGAVSDENIRRQLIPILMNRPEWWTSFLNFVANSSPDYRSAAVLFGELRARGLTFPNGAEASLLGALVSGRDYEAARIYLARGARQDVSSGSRAPNFAGTPATPSPFDWNPQNEVGVMASIQQGGRAGGGVFTFSTVSGAGGPVLRQLQLLRPGRYEIASRLTSIDPADASVFWTVQCVDGPELARFPITPRPGAPVRNGQFTVGAGCPAQWLTLNVSPSDQAAGVSGEMDYAQIRPAGGP